MARLYSHSKILAELHQTMPCCIDIKRLIINALVGKENLYI